MKPFLVGLATILMCGIWQNFAQDDALYLRKNLYLEFVAQEAAAAAAQYYDYMEYSQGRKVFNQIEGIKAVEYIIKSDLNLDVSFTPSVNSYWSDPITYQIFFYDDSNTVFPIIYTDSETNYVLTIGDPTIIVKINAGKGRYRLITTQPRAIRTAAHEWKSY